MLYLSVCYPLPILLRSHPLSIHTQFSALNVIAKNVIKSGHIFRRPCNKKLIDLYLRGTFMLDAIPSLHLNTYILPSNATYIAFFFNIFTTHRLPLNRPAFFVFPFQNLQSGNKIRI